MSLFSAVKNSVQSTVRSVQQTPPKVQAKVQAKLKQVPALALDTFAPAPRVSAGVGGVTVSDGRITAGFTAKDGFGISTRVSGETLGVSFKAIDGVATLGAVSFKAGGQEFVVGMVPQAPSPIPMPIYSGPERK